VSTQVYVQLFIIYTRGIATHGTRTFRFNSADPIVHICTRSIVTHDTLSISSTDPKDRECYMFCHYIFVYSHRRHRRTLAYYLTLPGK
jgi:hypothetical protein